MQFLVMTEDVGQVHWENHQTELVKEVTVILRMLQSGKLRNIWFTDKNDAVLLIEEESAENVAKQMDKLPLVLHCLISYRIIELKPYTGFERLIYGTD